MRVDNLYRALREHGLSLVSSASKIWLNITEVAGFFPDCGFHEAGTPIIFERP